MAGKIASASQFLKLQGGGDLANSRFALLALAAGGGRTITIIKVEELPSTSNDTRVVIIPFIILS